MLFRFTVRSTDAPPKFESSALVLPFAGYLEARDFGAEIIKKFDLFGPYDRSNGIAIAISAADAVERTALKKKRRVAALAAR
jgi:hypothetical protein